MKNKAPVDLDDLMRLLANKIIDRVLEDQKQVTNERLINNHDNA